MLRNPTKPAIFAIYLLVVITILALDRWSKITIEKALEIEQSIHLGSLFYFTLVHNHGGAFGILQNQKIIFISVVKSCIVLLIFLPLSFLVQKRRWVYREEILFSRLYIHSCFVEGILLPRNTYMMRV